MPAWLKDALFYEIYPQTYYDSNGDGIGDIPGVLMKLDYIQSLGFNAIWLNPCFVSPFMDAGYDVEDYYRVAPRYGSNEDLYHLFEEAHQRGMHIILDLVPGHTSDKCAWFQQSKDPRTTEMDDRYIWTNSVWDRPGGYHWEVGITDRDGCYMVNFFSSQPALNYGFHHITHPAWQIPYTDPRVKGTMDAMKDVMRFWLDHGADGFRVDMADSLVKNDEDKTATASLWRGVREMLDRDYPEAVLISEWCNGPRAINMAGFHGDFILDHHDKMTSLAFRKRDENGDVVAYFAKRAHVSAQEMLNKYMEEYVKTKGHGYLCPITGNHDTPRISHTLDESELRLAYLFLFTLPGVPFLYYGDEIGMRYLPGFSKEGGFNRTGARTPMQWESGHPNLGFSDADSGALYLDVDRAPDAPTVSSGMEDPDSLWHWVRSLTALRSKHPALGADGDLQILSCTEDSVLCYLRGDSICVVINPTDEIRTIPLVMGEQLLSTGNAATVDGVTTLAPQSAVVFRPVS